MIEEDWRPVVGWEGLYEVSSLGRVRSLPRQIESAGRSGSRRVTTFPGHILRGWRHGFGYTAFTASAGGKKRALYVHRVVCIAFHGPAPSPAHLVAHYDGDPTNNRASNVRWATPAENADDAKRHGTLAVGVRCANAKLNHELAREIRAVRGSTQSAIAKRFGVSQSQVQAVRSGKRWCEPGAKPIPENIGLKLSSADVAAIRLTDPATLNESLAKDYGVSKSHISGIRTGSQRKGG